MGYCGIVERGLCDFVPVTVKFARTKGKIFYVKP